MSDADEPALGSLERRDGRVLLRFARRLRYPRETVWRALTDPEHLAAWFPTTIDGDRAPGARLRFAHRDDAAPPSDGEMLAFEPPSVIELRWGEDILRLELEPDGEDGACSSSPTASTSSAGRRATGRDGTPAWTA